MSSKGYHISLLLKIDQNLIFWKDENPIKILQFCNNLLISLCTQISFFACTDSLKYVSSMISLFDHNFAQVKVS